MGFWTDKADVIDADKQPRRAIRKDQIPTKLDARKQDDRIDHAKLEKWRKEVHERDGNRCRYSKVKVERTLRLQPNRSECHHIEPRANRATRYDRRNGIRFAFVIHDRLERGDLKLIGSRFFVADDGQVYINADFPVFVLVWRERDHRTHGWVFDRVI